MHAEQVLKRPLGYWTNIKRQLDIIEQIAPKVGVKELSDWYSVSSREFKDFGGTALLRRTRKTLPQLISSLYPDFEWDQKWISGGRAPGAKPTRRNKVKLLAALEKAEKQLGITQPEDWYTVRLSDMEELGFPKGVGTVRFAELLKEKYPDQPWEKILVLKGKYSQQKRLERVVASLFPGVEMKVNARKEGGVMNPETGHFLELDIYFPSLYLAFEYHEKHHYAVVGRFTSKSLERTRKYDEVKQHAVKRSGITLITVPCWWDYRIESLARTVKDVRPDLAESMTPTEEAEPIPTEAPPDFFKAQIDHIEDIGEPTNPTFFTNSQVDPTDWWMFEKYDGVRGFWNPLKKAFYSRKGNKFTIPQEIIDSMPTDTFLDGELWFGRETFQEAMKISYRVDASQVKWDNFKFVVFDIPDAASKKSYSERYDQLLKVGEKGNKHIMVARYEQCRGTEHLEQFFQDIIDKGGEGIILRNPQSIDKPGRSPGYLKHKKFRDAEARVVGSPGPLRWECEL